MSFEKEMAFSALSVSAPNTVSHAHNHNIEHHENVHTHVMTRRRTASDARR